VADRLPYVQPLASFDWRMVPPAPHDIVALRALDAKKAPTLSRG